MTGIGGLCLNNPGLGCDSNAQCANNSCGATSVVVSYNFSGPSTSNMGTAFPSATSTIMKPVFNGPTGTTSPHKMFVVSQGSLDTLYLVDNNLGFLSLQYNTFTGVVTQDWTTLIPHQTTETGPNENVVTTKVLVDVGTNAQQNPTQPTYLVAFFETLTSGGSPVSNYTVYEWDGTNFTVFNLQRPNSGLPGTQYNANSSPLSISYIHISPSNQLGPGGDVLISYNGTVYVKPYSASLYLTGIVQGGPRDQTPMTGVTGPAYFYYDIEENSSAPGPVVCPARPNITNPINCSPTTNISFVGPFVSYGGAHMLNVVQFSGNIAGTAQPNDVFTLSNPADEVQYQVFDYSIYSSTLPSPSGDPPGMQSAATIMLAQATVQNSVISNVVALNYGGAGAIFPYQIGTSFRAAASANAYYIISPGSCN